MLDNENIIEAEVIRIAYLSLSNFNQLLVRVNIINKCNKGEAHY